MVLIAYIIFTLKHLWFPLDLKSQHYITENIYVLLIDTLGSSLLGQGINATDAITAHAYEHEL